MSRRTQVFSERTAVECYAWQRRYADAGVFGGEAHELERRAKRPIDLANP
ncbi:MAG TPA: hypothetical protein VGP85_05225 [Pyrinomonadaceae bacterium]|nr:hypothetical protein [Pyrinomonadaceae bacterium]